MDYQSQTVHDGEMDKQLADLLIEMKAITNRAETISDELENDYNNAVKAISTAAAVIDSEYEVLDSIENESEEAFDAIILEQANLLSEEI